MAETSTIFGFMKYVSATDILSDFKKTVDSHFVNSLKVEIILYSQTVDKMACSKKNVPIFLNLFVNFAKS